MQTEVFLVLVPDPDVYYAMISDTVSATVSFPESLE